MRLPGREYRLWNELGEDPGNLLIVEKQRILDANIKIVYTGRYV